MEKTQDANYKELIFDTWYEAVAFAQKKQLWGKVVLTEKENGKYVIEDK